MIQLKLKDKNTLLNLYDYDSTCNLNQNLIVHGSLDFKRPYLFLFYKYKDKIYLGRHIERSKTYCQVCHNLTKIGNNKPKPIIRESNHIFNIAISKFFFNNVQANK